MIKYIDKFNSIKAIPLVFVNDMLKNYIDITITNFFPKLNQEDINILKILVTFVIDMISKKYHFDKSNIIYYKQWTQNNCRDIKGVILLLLPYIDDKLGGYLLKEITDLNQFLYNYSKKVIPKNLTNFSRDEILSSDFKFGNMGVGLIPINITKESEGLLDLYVNDEKKIYEVMYHNFIGLLQTLEIMNGKYYINWINIVPLNLKNYKESNLYKQTVERVKLLESNEFLIINNTNIYDYTGLWFGDLYNVLRNKFYEETKLVKWFIFPYEFMDNQNMFKQIYLVQGLNIMLDLNSIIESEYTDYNDLPDNIKTTFKNRCDELYIRLISNTTYTGLMTVDLEIIKYLLIDIINNMAAINSIKLPIINKFKLNNEEDMKDDYTKNDMMKINKITNTDIVECYQYIVINHINNLWTYLKENLGLLKNSVFGNMLIQNNRIMDTYYYKGMKSLNLKNIYNIAKSLSHITIDASWVLLDKNYISLKPESRQLFFDRIQDRVDSKTWINLSGNFRRQYVNIDVPGNILVNILDDFENSFIDIVFEELIRNGILNRFEVNLEITDKTILPANFASRKAKVKDLIKNKFKANKDMYGESYYYLTNDMFKNLPKIRFEKKNAMMNDKYEDLTYFELIVKDHDWPNFYAMDWISQISFFQHYIYHQVMYVTGATGQGKSTQVPKLLLYALKAIDYKYNGKVICTQPRVTPTVDNATRIAEELGVPIQQPSNNSYVPIKTDNTYIQFKHQQEAFTSNDRSKGFLRIVTDGTLLEELIQNPTLKQKRIRENGEIITNNNIYDIVIVDEAHEHNINMDLIITITKQACFYNNMVRLIIVSATMDDDEPIYRRYFKTINDNLLFPIKYPINFLVDNFLPNPEYMDRRYHISPPGESTQYRVDEIYLEENINIFDSDDMKESAKKAQLLGYKKIKEICEKTVTGEILFFANGMKEINDAVEHLNKILPDGNIALPFYSELNENYKNIVTKIDSKISSIKNRRENITKEWGPTFIQDMSVPNGIYKRAVIIATNVAEASITLNSLKFVVDNGFAKVNKFKPEIGIESLIVEEISEASRVQRKGRVGRVGDGIVYYMYKKFAKQSIKPNYKITQVDVCPSIIKLLGNKELEDKAINDFQNISKLIVPASYSPNFFSFMTNYQNLSDSNSDIYVVSSGLFDLFKTNYFINNEPLSNIYYENISIRMDSNYMEYYAFNTGQIFNNMMDRSGQFYLIHPLELDIKRNIINQIIKVNNKNTNLIPTESYIYILSYLFDKNLIVDLYGEKLYNYIEDIKESDRCFVSTELAQQYKMLSREFMTTIPETINLISASAMGCFNEVIRLILFIKKLAPFYSLSAIISKNIKWNEYKNLFSDHSIKSDIIFIHNILETLHRQFDHMLVFNINTPEFQNRIQQNVNSKIEKFKLALTKSKDPPIDFNPSLWNKLLNLRKNGKLVEESMKVFRTDAYIIDMINDDIEKNKSKIEKWCYNNYLDFDFIIRYIEDYMKYFLSKNITQDNPVIVWAKNFKSNFNKYLTTNTIEEKILRSFLYGYPSQYTYSSSDVTKNNYVTYLNRAFYPVYFAVPYIKGQLKESEERETMTNLSNELTFYFNYSELKDMNDDSRFNVKLLNQIDPMWLLPAMPLFMNPLCTSEIVITHSLIYDRPSNVIYLNSSAIDRFKKTIINSWNKGYILWDSEYTPILQYFYKKINHTISKSFKF
jgi:hypothetical protein